MFVRPDHARHALMHGYHGVTMGVIDDLTARAAQGTFELDLGTRAALSAAGIDESTRPFSPGPLAHAGLYLFRTDKSGRPMKHRLGRTYLGLVEHNVRGRLELVVGDPPPLSRTWAVKGGELLNAQWCRLASGA